MKRTRLIAALLLPVFLLGMMGGSAHGSQETTWPDPEGTLTVIWGMDAFATGMRMGEPDSDTKKYVADNLAGSAYEWTIREGTGGQSGKYGEIKVLSVPAFSYVNPILDFTKLDSPPSDWKAYSELWVWVDLAGFGPQEDGTDFSIQAYERDYKDGSPVEGKFERWAIMTDGIYYLQEGTGWKELVTKKHMITPLPKDYKGWVRVPFSSMDVVALLGAYNCVFDKEEVISVVLGIPCDESRVGSSMKIDSIALFAEAGSPTEEPTSGPTPTPSGDPTATTAATPTPTSPPDATGTPTPTQAPEASPTSAATTPGEGSPTASPTEQAATPGATPTGGQQDTRPNNTAIILLAVVAAVLLAGGTAALLLVRKKGK